MTVTPVLTPDAGVYVKAVAELIASATKTLYLQFQYIEPPAKSTAANQAFRDLIAAVVAKQSEVDLRIVMGHHQSQGDLEQLQGLGLDVKTQVKIQNNVHNKGIIVDSARVHISSQNWSAAGTLLNRDAGVIIENQTVAGYFQEIFLHDWTHLARPKALPD